MKIDYAGLQLLRSPLLDRLEMIPASQRQAIEVVFALSASRPEDRGPKAPFILRRVIHHPTKED